MIKIKSVLLFLLTIISVNLYSQNFVYKGVVKDLESNQNLAFVNILSNNGIGATTNIDGKFEMVLTDKSSKLNFSYIGYEAKSIEIKREEENHIIYLRPKIFNLDEVEIFPGINPAHRIIDSVLKYRDINDPKKLKNSLMFLMIR